MSTTIARPATQSRPGTPSAGSWRASADEQRSAHLLFAEEIVGGLLTLDDVLAVPEVRDAVRTGAVPSLLGRAMQRVQAKRGKLTYLGDCVEPMLRARRAVLGEAAHGPPRYLVRVDEFPHYEVWERPDVLGTEAFERFHAIMHGAGVPYLLAVTPRVARASMDPQVSEWRAHDAAEAGALRRVARDPGMSFGVHGLDHRTRDAHPRRHSELSGLGRRELAERLDAADATMAAAGLSTNILVPPFNGLEAEQFAQLAARYEVLTGGPENIKGIGFHRAPLWREGTVHLPAYKPLYGRAEEVLAGAQELEALRPALWVPIVLHWGWEREDDGAALERLAAHLAGKARPWEEFLTATRAGRAAVPGRALEHTG